VTVRNECLEKAVVDAVVVSYASPETETTGGLPENNDRRNSPTFPTGNEIRADLAIVACVALLKKIL
jgi:hypothetical protein